MIVSENYRLLNPVGHGGFDVEEIDGTRVVFDCGSTPRRNVENVISLYWNHLTGSEGGRPRINYVFLSHLDRDHVNGLESLSRCFNIRNIIIPYIPPRYRVIYNYATDFAVTAFYNLVVGSNKRAFENSSIIGTNQFSGSSHSYFSVKSSNRKWEWVYKSLFSCRQWEELRNSLQKMGIEVEASKGKSQNMTALEYQESEGYLYEDDFRDDEITNPGRWYEEIASIEESWGREQYAENQNPTPEGMPAKDFDILSYITEDSEISKKGKIRISKEKIQGINKAIGKIWGKNRSSYVKNENGLLILSKKLVNQTRMEVYYKNLLVESGFFKDGLYYYYGVQLDYHDIRKRFPRNSHLSACLYTGDMRFDVKSCPTILDFLKMVKEKLLMFQIPHHGSRHNNPEDFPLSIPSQILFWHDRDDIRIRSWYPCHVYLWHDHLMTCIDVYNYLYCKIEL